MELTRQFAIFVAMGTYLVIRLGTPAKENEFFYLSINRFLCNLKINV